jgi:hypothetical protein
LALEIIRPFIYRTFNAELGETARAIINQFKENDSNFWQATLRRYSFQGSDYQQGEQVRLKFNEKITTCTEGELFAVANEILEWGGMDSLTSAMKQEPKKSLVCLNVLARNETIDLNELCVERLASITKI